MLEKKHFFLLMHSFSHKLCKVVAFELQIIIRTIILNILGQKTIKLKNKAACCGSQGRPDRAMCGLIVPLISEENVVEVIVDMEQLLGHFLIRHA